MRKPFYILVLILIIGTALRIYNLGNTDFWLDEASSIFFANNIGLCFISKDPNPPLYIILLSFWLKLFGKEEYIIRLLSVIFGVLAIFVSYKLGTYLFNKHAGLINAFILSISPFHIWYSQEARGYALFCFLVLLTSYLFFLALEKDKNYLWGLFTFSLVLSAYTSYFTFFLIGGEATVFVIRKYRPFAKKWLMSCFFTLLVFLPRGTIFLRSFSKIKINFWITKPNLKSLIITLENFNLGYNATPWTYKCAIFLSIILFISCLLLYRKGPREIKNKLSALFLILFIPIISIFFLSKFIPIYIDRQLLTFSGFYYLLISVGLMNIRNRILKVVLVATFCILCGLALFNYYLQYMPSNYAHHLGAYVKKPFNPAIQFINKEIREKDIIAHTCPVTLMSFIFYLNPPQTSQYYFLSRAQDKYWRENFDFIKSRYNIPFIILNLEDNPSNFKRIWLISSNWARDGRLDNNSVAVRKWIVKRYGCIYEYWFNGILVELYELKG